MEPLEPPLDLLLGSSPWSGHESQIGHSTSSNHAGTETISIWSHHVQLSTASL